MLPAAVACGGSPAELALEDEIELRIVAHEDDDLLFMNPDLAESIEAGRTVRTVFLTAGDAGRGQSYWRGREEGILAAYAAMAGAADKWETSVLQLAAHEVEVRQLAGQPRVSLVFLRLPDGGSAGQGFAVNAGASLAKLWRKRIESIKPVDGSAPFSRGELIALLGEMMARFHPQTVDTQDWTHRFQGDHSDHLHSALFARAAAVRYRAPHATRVYRGSNINLDPPNLPPAERALKESIFLAYAEHDALLCPPGVPCAVRGHYQRFVARQYPYFAGALLGPGGKCLHALPHEGRAVLRSCHDLPAQRWTEADGELRNAAGNCLALGSRAAGVAAVRVEACTGGATQTWTLASGGALTAAGSCATIRAGGADLVAGECGDGPERSFRLYPPR